MQRVNKGTVTVNSGSVGSISRGFVILLGVGLGDVDQDARYLAEKIAHLRVFEDDNGKMNLSLGEVEGQALVVSQFTLFGDCRKGRRPSFSQAAAPDGANQLYQCFVESLQSYNIPVSTGVFQAHMVVELENDGPVTLLLSSKGEF